MKLYAISDLHVGQPDNRAALQTLPRHPDDWLIVAGDIGDTVEQITWALDLLVSRFAQVLWTPGNHDLWTLPRPGFPALVGEALYRRLVEICRQRGVLTPEDPFVRWPGPGGAYVLAPTFTLYDYSFRPDHIAVDQAVQWAEEAGIVCTDEHLLHPTPYPSRAAWCQQRCAYTEARLDTLVPADPIVLINHYPLHQDHARLPLIPRFMPWCGTRLTEHWPRRFNIQVVVHGHLHIRNTIYRDGVRFEEVSLGYPRQWDRHRPLTSYLREILPGQ